LTHLPDIGGHEIMTSRQPDLIPPWSRSSRKKFHLKPSLRICGQSEGCMHRPFRAGFLNSPYTQGCALGSPARPFQGLRLPGFQRSRPLKRPEGRGPGITPCQYR
jgi:hypothetical protein